MAKKPKLPFSPLAVALLMKEVKMIEFAFNREGYRATDPLSNDQHISEDILRGGIAGKVNLALRRVLRKTIEVDPIYTHKYIEYLEKANQLENTEKKEGFSITVKGAGTKEQVIDSLQTVIVILQGKTITELQDGMNIEMDETTCLKTDTFEEYTGYPIEEE